SAPPAHEQVVHYTAYPGVRILEASYAVPVPPSSEEGLLGRVLGILDVAGEQVGLADEARFGLVEEVPELLPLERHPGLLRRRVPHRLTRTRGRFRITQSGGVP